jgi:hypothetical protein
LSRAKKEDAINGLKQLLTNVAGSDHIAQNRLIRMLNDKEAVVAYERILTKESSINMAF